MNGRVLKCVKSNALVTLKEEIANSGEGRVYLTNTNGLLAKIYHSEKLSKERVQKLKAMIDAPPADYTKGQHNHVSIAWPRDLIADNGLVYGFLMPTISDAVNSVEATHPEHRCKWNPDFTYQHALVAAQNFCSAVDAIHSSGHVLGDIKRENIMVKRNGLISIIDTDSFQIYDRQNQKKHFCPVTTPEFTPPELMGRDLSNIERVFSHDYFGVAVIVHYLLMNGEHPFEGRWNGPPPNMPVVDRIKAGYWSNGPYLYVGPRSQSVEYSHFPEELKDLFARAFSRGHGNPKVRPTAREWKSAIERSRKSLVGCLKNKNHVFFNRAECTWCKHAEKIGLDVYDANQVINKGSAIIKQNVPVSPSLPAPSSSTPATPVSPAKKDDSDAWLGCLIWIALIVLFSMFGKK